MIALFAFIAFVISAIFSGMGRAWALMFLAIGAALVVLPEVLSLVG